MIAETLLTIFGFVEKTYIA